MTTPLDQAIAALKAFLALTKLDPLTEHTNYQQDVFAATALAQDAITALRAPVAGDYKCNICGGNPTAFPYKPEPGNWGHGKKMAVEREGPENILGEKTVTAITPPPAAGGMKAREATLRDCLETISMQRTAPEREANGDAEGDIEYAFDAVIDQGRKALAALNARATQPEARPDTAREILQSIIDWADLALENPKEFNNSGVRNLDGPIFDKAREFLSNAGKEKP